MSDLSRLRELAALFRPKEQVIEDTAPNAALTAFDNLKHVVEDAISDLEDKLAEGGGLESLLDRHGVSSKVDFVHLAKGLETYKKETMKILDEVETVLMSIPSDDELKAHDDVLAKHAKSA